MKIKKMSFKICSFMLALFVFCTAVFFIKRLNSRGNTSNVDIVTLNDLSSQQIIHSSGDFADFNYKELKENAVSLVKVEVIDELTSANSFSHMDEDGCITSFYSVRTARILDIYQDSCGFRVGDEIKIQDWAAIYEENGQMYMDSYGPEPLKKDSTYILYLDDENTKSGYPCIISGSLGQIDLNNLSEKAPNYDIMIKTIVEYESDWPDKLKESVLTAEEIRNVQAADNVEKRNIRIETAAGNVDAAIAIEKDAGSSLSVNLDILD